MNTSLNKRLKKHPQLEKHMEGLLDLVENQNGEYNYANETESKLIQKMRNFGQDILKKWAECREEKETKQWDKEKEKRRKHGKKKYTGKPPMGR